MSDHKPRINIRYLLLLLAFVLADVIGVNYILKAFDDHGFLYQFWTVVSLLILQILAAPIQTGFSDFYCRKKTLVIALFFSLSSILLVYIYTQMKSPSVFLPILIIGIKGCFGNIIPLSWATIADIQGRNPRFSFGLATGGYAFGYLMLVASNHLLKGQQLHFIVIGIFLILTFLCLVCFKDTRDKSDLEKLRRKPFSLLILQDNKLIIADLIARYLRKILISFLMWEVSLYTILLLYVDFFTDEFSMLPVGMMIGYLFGIGLLKFCDKNSDLKMIKIGYYLSIASLIPVFASLFFVEHMNSYLLVFCYFFHSMGNAFLCPTLFAIIARVSPPHAWGRKYGLVESSDSLAFLFAFVILLGCQKLGLGLGTIVTISFLSITLSLLPYREFCKTVPKKVH